MTPPDIRQISNDANYWQREANYWRNRYADALSRLDAAERTAVDYRKQVDQISQAVAAAYRLIEELTSDRDALAMQCDELQEDYVLLQNLAGATTQAMQEVGAEADKLRGALEQVLARLHHYEAIDSKWIKFDPTPTPRYITEDQLLSMLGFPRSNE